AQFQTTNTTRTFQPTSDSWGASFNYNGNGLVTGVSADPVATMTIAPAAGEGLVTSPAVNALTSTTAQPGSVTDAQPYTPTYLLDPAGQLRDKESPTGAVEQWAIDATNGLPDNYFDPNGAGTIYTYYDTYGNISGVVYPDGGLTTFSYGTSHYLLQVESQLIS